MSSQAITAAIEPLPGADPAVTGSCRAGRNCRGCCAARQNSSARTCQRAERHGDRPGRQGLVLRPGQVAVEDPADRVAGQVLQDGIDDELVRPGRPRGRGAPAATIAPRGRPPACRRPAGRRDRSHGGSGRAGRGRAAGRTRRRAARRVARGGTVSVQSAGLDVAALVVADLVAPLGPGAQRGPGGVAEPGVDDEAERLRRAAAGSRPARWPTRPRLMRAGSSRTVRRRRPASHSSCSVGSRAPAQRRRRHRRRAGRARRPSPRSSAPRTARRAGAGCAAPRRAVGWMASTSVGGRTRPAAAGAGPPRRRRRRRRRRSCRRRTRSGARSTASSPSRHQPPGHRRQPADRHRRPPGRTAPATSRPGGQTPEPDAVLAAAARPRHARSRRPRDGSARPASARARRSSASAGAGGRRRRPAGPARSCR